MSKRIKVWSFFLLLLILPFSLFAEEIDVMRVTRKANELKNAVDSLTDDTPRINLHLPRDPFAAPLFRKNGGETVKSETPPVSILKETAVLPPVRVSGIIFNPQKPVAIINNEVKKEGERIGEIEVYRIEKDRVLIKYRNEIFPCQIGQ